MGNESSRVSGGSGGRGDRPRQRSVSPSKQGFGRATSNALDKTFGGQDWYQTGARPYVHEKYHQRDADAHKIRGNDEGYKSDMFNAERHHNIRNNIPQSYNSDGSFDKQKMVETREARQNQEKEMEKYKQDQKEKECRDEMILRNGWTDTFPLQSDMYSGKKK